MSKSTLPNWEEIHKNSTVVDMHAHPSLKVSFFKRMLTSRGETSRFFNPFSVRSNFLKLKKGGIDVLLSTICTPEREILKECTYIKILKFLMPFTWRKVFGHSYFDVTNKMMDEMEKVVQKSFHPETGQLMAKMAYSVKELEKILGQGKDRPTAVIHNIEGAHSLDGKLDNLQHFFDRGVAYISLAHFYENEVVHPCFPFPESVQILKCFRGDRNPALGLKKFGEQVIEKMIELGMMVDISHCTPPARKRIFEIVGNRIPIIAAHVGAYEINPSPYNLKDWEIKKIAASGGCTGVIFMNYWLMPHETKRGLNFIARTINHFTRIGGINHVAFGTDFDGFTDPPDDLKDASELPKLTQRLLAEEYTEEEIGKILGSNALRVLREGWGRK